MNVAQGNRWLIGLALVLAATRSSAAPRALDLDVDARDAPRGVYHVSMRIPVEPGKPLTLNYPKWVQGEHSATGPIMQLTGLVARSGETTLPWRRNPFDMFEVAVEVPASVAVVDVAFDYLSPPEVFGAGGYGESPNSTPHLVIVDWHDLVLFPKGAHANDTPISATLHLPSGWRFDTALPLQEERDNTIHFAATTLYTLTDSPVLASDRLRIYDLGQNGIVERIAVAADRVPQTIIPTNRLEEYRRLPLEARELFGARHYRGYHWLLALGSQLDENGLEHHESSDDRANPEMFTAPTRLLQASTLLAHEYVHSWNGKYRRPQGLATDTPQAPLNGDLLWVYEGMTRYLGDLVLATRSGLRSEEDSLDYLAWVAANQDRNRPGRRWRPLLDTAVSVDTLESAPTAWTAARRALDYYDESLLIWLEVDALIRSRSKGERSLDDFCRMFFGGSDTVPAVVPYNREDVIAALNAVQPYDWRGFFAQRIDAVTPQAPLGGLEAAGWRLIYSPKPNEYQQARATNSHTTDLSFTLGLWLKPEGSIEDIDVGGPAWEAGLGPGMKVLAINGKIWSPEIANEEIAATDGAKGLSIIAARGEEVRTYAVPYHDGMRYPHLERTSGADLLSAILSPRGVLAKHRKDKDTD